MRHAALAVLLGAWAASCAAAPEFGGHLMPIVTVQRPNPQGPLALAAGLSPGVATLPASSLALETELRASGHGLTAVATRRDERPEGGRATGRGWVNELYAAGGGDTWQFSAGRKIVGWDVGYGFRPNDIVQQETRRLLLSTTQEGRPLAMVERFGADTAFSLVLVNPGAPRERRGAREPALALRAYRREGALDAYAFARWGLRTRGSAGAALAWVAGDAVELHASARWLANVDTLRIDASATGLQRSNPWQAANLAGASRALIGGTWTGATQWSLLLEAWHDGSAPSHAQWEAWNTRNRQLAALAGTPAPAAAVAGNLAWQASAFDAAPSLQRSNVFARLSWKHEAWEPAIDLLLTPADRGRVITASIAWQGDRLRLDAGWRRYGGPAGAALAQLPSRGVAFGAATWPF